MDIHFHATLALILGSYGWMNCLGEGGQSQRICYAQDCNSTAKRILDYMDPNVSPCQDFYQFACGRYVQTAVIPKDKTRVGAFSETSDLLKKQMKSVFFRKIKPVEPRPYQMLKTFVQICMDEKKADKLGVQPALRMIEKAGGWPVLGRGWNDKTWDLVDTLATLYTTSISGGTSLFVTSMSALDLKNSSRRLIEIDPAKFTLGSQVLSAGLNDSRVAAYFDFMVDVAVIFGADRKDAIKQLYSSLMLEIELAKLALKQEETRNLEDLYHLYTVPELMSKAPWFDWKRFLQQILPKKTLPLRSDDVILIPDAEYLEKVGSLISKFDRRTLSNYVMWRAVHGYAGFLTTELKNRIEKLDAAVLGSSSRAPRWEECVQLAEESFDVASSSMYVKNFFDQRSKDVATKIMHLVKDEWQRVLTEIEWMDDRTRAKALKKLSKIYFHVGYPDELLDTEKINEYYDGLNIRRDDDLLSTVLAIYAFDQNKSALKLRLPVNKTNWDTHVLVTMVNAFYVPLENAVVIPAGILQDLFFGKDLPIYVNLAKIGLVVGHEMTHAFDDQGSQMDENGNLRNWWGNESLTRFKEKSNCMVDFFSGLKDPITKMKVKGINIQGETVADQGALKLLYRVWKRMGKPGKYLPGLQKYSRDQALLLSLANIWCEKETPKLRKMRLQTDAHPPSDIRVNGLMKNFPHFQKIFHCKRSDPMVSEKRCEVW